MKNQFINGIKKRNFVLCVLARLVFPYSNFFLSKQSIHHADFSPSILLFLQTFCSFLKKLNVVVQILCGFLDVSSEL